VLDAITERIAAREPRIEQLLEETPMLALLQTLPGVGKILASVSGLESGTIARFAPSERLGS
jgi:transposase